MYSYIIYIMASFENAEEKYAIYKNMCDDLIGRFESFSTEDEIYNLSTSEKNMIVLYIKNFTYDHIEKYGYIDDDNYNLYLILEILRHFGIEMDIGVDVTEIDDYCDRFRNIMKRCNKNFINDLKSEMLYN